MTNILIVQSTDKKADRLPDRIAPAILLMKYHLFKLLKEMDTLLSRIIYFLLLMELVGECINLKLSCHQNLNSSQGWVNDLDC